MEITPQKISEILSDPQKLSLISSLVSGMSSPDTQQQTQEKENKEEETAEVANFVPHTNNIQKNVYDDRINLLNAVRPFLGDGKKQKVDGLIKALGAARVIGNLKGTDIFNFLS